MAKISGEKNVKCVRIVVALACFCLWIAIVASVVGFFSPAWITMETPKQRVHIGLVVYCRYSTDQGFNLKDNCTWFKSLDVETPGWMIAARGLTGVGFVLMILTAMGFLFLCGRKFQNAECSSFIITGNFLAFGSMICSVVTFGIKASQDYEAEFVDRKGFVYLDWSYYMAIIGAGFSLFSLVIISTAVYFTSTEAKNRMLHQNGNYMYMEQKG